MIEIFYEGYAFTIEKYEYKFDDSDKYFSKITLPNDKASHFWDYDVVSSTWENCLFESLTACKAITIDYGINPINIGEVELFFNQSHPECDSNEIPF
jgi:hypothetical protein